MPQKDSDSDSEADAEMKFETLKLARKVVTDAFIEIRRLDKFDPLRNQASRSAIRVVSNIAEVNQRKGRDRRQLFLVAKGSLSELNEQLLLIPLNPSNSIFEDIDRLGGMIYGLIKKSESESESASAHK